ncbi:MAG: hypothetical protein QG671_2398 [Actinomycetota bacterium]|nr:hypothetical protein [Actinomycetota bacterium]
MPFFLAPLVLLVIGWGIHVLLDRKPNRRTGHRVVELALLWVMVWLGAWALFGGLLHLGPTAGAIAESIGYAPSMFQWEVGWADIAIGVLGVGCAWKARRDGWLTAAVVVLAISYWGDAIGHIMQYYAHDNTATSNVWAIPSDILQPLLAIILLVAYRRGERKLAAQADPAAGSPTSATTTPAL